jgi:hypothetical protein
MTHNPDRNITIPFPEDIDIIDLPGMPTIAECHALAAQVGMKFVPHSPKSPKKKPQPEAVE